jgi:hypothetical protein
MSKGPGRIQRQLALIFDLDPEGAFTIEELCERIYETESITKSHRVAVIRAAKALAKKHPGLEWWRSEGRGSTLVFFHHDNVMSYGMARLKSDCLSRHDDERVLWKRLRDEEHRKLSRPGGWWWLHVQTWIGERDGDTTKLKELAPIREALEQESAAGIKAIQALLKQLGHR